MSWARLALAVGVLAVVGAFDADHCCHGMDGRPTDRCPTWEFRCRTLISKNREQHMPSLQDPFTTCMSWVGSEHYGGPSRECCFEEDDGKHTCPTWEARCARLVNGTVNYKTCMEWVGSRYYSEPSDGVVRDDSGSVVMALLMMLLLVLAVLLAGGLVRGLFVALIARRAIMGRVAAQDLANAQDMALAAAIRSIPSSAYQGTGADGEDCAICLSPFDVGQVLRSLPCEHRFHAGCIDAWFLQKSGAAQSRTRSVPRCPLCKISPLTEQQLQSAGLHSAPPETHGAATQVVSLGGSQSPVVLGAAGSSNDGLSLTALSVSAPPTSHPTSPGESDVRAGAPGHMLV